MTLTAPARAASRQRLSRPARAIVLVLFALGLVWASLDLFTLVVYLSYGLVGLLLVLRRPDNAVSWLVLAIALVSLTTTMWPSLDTAGLVQGTAPEYQVLLVWLASWSGYLLFVGFLALTLVFPSGRLPSGRWRRPAIALLTAALGLALFPAFLTPMTATIESGRSVTIPNPTGLLRKTEALEAVPAITVVLLAVGVGSMLIRYRRSTGLDRLQLRWLVATLGFVAIGLAAAFVTIAIGGDQVGDLVWAPLWVAYPAVPVAIAVAILRYRLYAIDRIISRTLSWAVVTGIVGSGFLLILLALQAVLGGVTQGDALAVALSTLAAFALLQPVRARVQAVVDRRFDRARIDAQRTAERFAERLREEVDLEAIRGDLQQTVETALRPRGVGVWLRERAGR